MGLETALLATLVASSAVSAYQSYESAQDTKAAARKQEDATRKLAANEERNKLQTVMRNQKRRGATGEPGLRDTILTGPLGIANQPQAAQKTLLGL